MANRQQSNLIIEWNELLDDYSHTVTAHILDRKVPRSLKLGLGLHLALPFAR